MNPTYFVAARSLAMTKKKALSFILSVLLMFLCGCGSASRKLTGEEVYKKIAPSTVEITAEGSGISSLGSGFYIDDAGTVVTNYHVIENCSSAYVTTYDGGIYPVTAVVGFDKDLDIALLTTTKQSSTPVAVSAKAVSTGEVVYALGSSLGLTGTFSEGLVSAAEREIDGIPYIQISAPISSGNSGGPLVNDKGEVVGITSAGFDDGQNLNLAIPINVLDKVANQDALTMDEFFVATAGKSLTPTSVGIRTATFQDPIYANYILEMWLSGPADEGSLILTLNAYAEDQGGGQLYIIEPGDFVKQIDEWCFDPARRVGDYGIIENQYGVSICYISSIDYQIKENGNHAELGLTDTQYRLAKKVADNVDLYCEYMAELRDMTIGATYSEDIQKEKATDFLNNLPLDYGQRIILYRIQFPEDSTYNEDIVDYLNERDDVSYDDMVFILEELGFAVFSDGTVKW